MRESYPGGKRRTAEHRRTASERTHLYAWPPPREKGGLAGVSLTIL
jgi:hypothetical protein